MGRDAEVLAQYKRRSASRTRVLCRESIFDQSKATAKQVTKVGDRKNDYAKHYYAGNYAAKAPFSFTQKSFTQHFAQQKPIFFD